MLLFSIDGCFSCTCGTLRSRRKVGTRGADPPRLFFRVEEYLELDRDSLDVATSTLMASSQD